jgi:gamma-glutamylcyclotransferase (GGCT)/AIG2-like uncharacterized protein YtfP
MSPLSDPPQPPPLLPLLLASAFKPRQGGQQTNSPSPFEAKLQSAPPDYLTNIPITQYEPQVYQPVYYFFYGTLTQPETLKRVLDLQEEPELRKAQIVGYSVAKWSHYPTLLDGPPGNVISGYAYMVQSEDHEHKLARYETNAYKVAPCHITFTDGLSPSQLVGKTFMYAGGPKVLLEKRFDHMLWARQIGQSSPFDSCQL